MRSFVGWTLACVAGGLTIFGCKEEPPKYPPPVYIDYTKPAPTQTAPTSTSPTPTSAPGPGAAAQEGPTIGDALAPFGIVLPPNISLLKLPPPSVWQNWPFTWPNLPQAGTTAAGNPPARGGNNTPPVTAPQASAPTPTPGVPSPAAVPPGWSALEHEVLLETNRRRAEATRCGNQLLPPAPALQPSLELGRAAHGHSDDMARQNYFDHTSLDGRSVEQRTRAAGFPGGFIGENIAAGRPDAKGTVQQWVDSPGHCLNLMEPRYRFLGVGYAKSASDRLTHFWTQNFGG